MPTTATMFTQLYGTIVAMAITAEAVSTAVVAALTFAKGVGATEIAKKAAGDAYEHLKSFIHTKFGMGSEVAQAVAKLEANPTSEPRKNLLTEELITLDATSDPAFLAAALSLLNSVRSVPLTEQHTQSVVGNYNALADSGGVAQVNIYSEPKRE